MVRTQSAGRPEGFDPQRVRFVLVQPQSGGNIGSAARALKNLGFRRLELVGPRCDPLGREARKMAVDAGDLLERAARHDTLDSALRGARTVVGTSRRTGKHRRPHYRLDEIAPEIACLAGAGELAVVFGREEHGLSDAELDRCTHLLHLPACELYPSFNLAQSVLLVAYELRRAGLEPAPDPLDAPARHEEREEMYAHLRGALVTIGFLQRDTADPIMRRFRRLFGRASATADEVRMLRGLARQVLWTARQAGLPIAADGDGPDAAPDPRSGVVESE